MTTDLSVFFNSDEFAETVSYTAIGAAAANITAIVERDAIFQESYVRGPDTAKCTIRVKRSEVSNPQHGDEFAIINCVNTSALLWELYAGSIYMTDLVGEPSSV